MYKRNRGNRDSSVGIFIILRKAKTANVLHILGGVASAALYLTEFYHSGKPKIQKRSFSGYEKRG